MKIAQAPQDLDITVSPPSMGISPSTSLDLLFRNAFIILVTASMVLCLAFVIWGSIEYPTSAGDKEKIASARKKIASALVGLALLAISFFIVRLISQIVGFNFGLLAIPRFPGGS